MDTRIIQRKLAVLLAAAREEVIALPRWGRRTARHQGPGDYSHDGTRQKTSLPCHVPAGRTVFFRASVRAPASIRLADAYFVFAMEELEGQLSIGGKPYAGIDRNHLRVPVLSRGRHDLELECLSVPRLFCCPERAQAEGRMIGARICTVRRDIEAFCADVQYAFEAAEVCLDHTPFYRIRVSKEGAIRSLYDKRHGREVVASGCVANDLQLFQDGPEHEDAWNLHASFEKRRYPFAGESEIEVLETGPARGAVRVRRTHRGSSIQQAIAVYATGPVNKVRSCNLVEEDGDELSVRDGSFRFHISPFQIRTFRLLNK